MMGSACSGVVVQLVRCSGVRTVHDVHMYFSQTFVFVRDCVVARDWKEEVCLLLHPPCSPLSNKSFLTSPDFISQKN